MMVQLQHGLQLALCMVELRQVTSNDGTIIAWSTAGTLHDRIEVGHLQ